MLLRQLSLPALLLLTACGGGGGPTTEEIDLKEDNELADDALDTPTDVVPIEDLVADDDDDDDTPPPPTAVTFEINDRPVIVTRLRQEGSETSIPDADQIAVLDELSLEATFNVDGTVTLTSGGESVTVTLNEADGNFTGTNGEVFGFLNRRYQRSVGVETVLFNFNDNEFQREGFLVIGDDATVEEVNAQTGVATYRGLMSVRINTNADLEGNSTESLNGNGGGRLIVNFDDDTVSGAFNVSDPTRGRETPAEGNGFPRIRVNLEESSIADGAFGGDVNLVFRDDEAFGNPDVAFSDGSYTGSFYGDEAISAGGQMSGLLQNGDDTYAVQGAFATNRPPE